MEPQEFQVFTEEQARIFMATTKGNPLEALFLLALTTSMRKGEILWPDVDWEKGTLRVERQLQPVSFEGCALVPTKTKSSRRAIMIGKVSIALLKEQHEKQERAPLRGAIHRNDAKLGAVATVPLEIIGAAILRGG